MNNLDVKIEKYYRNWRGYLIKYLAKHGDDIDNYNDEIIRELFADGLTTKQAYRQLQTEIKKETDS